MATTTYSALYDANGKPLFVYGEQNGSNIAIAYTIPVGQLNTDDVSYLIPVPLGRPLTAIACGISVDGDSGSALNPDLVYRIEKTDGTFSDTVLVDSSALSDVLAGALTTHRSFLLGDASQWGGLRIVNADARYPYAHIIYKVAAGATTPVETVITVEVRFR